MNNESNHSVLFDADLKLVQEEQAPEYVDFRIDEDGCLVPVDTDPRDWTGGEK